MKRCAVLYHRFDLPHDRQSRDGGHALAQRTKPPLEFPADLFKFNKRCLGRAVLGRFNLCEPAGQPMEWLVTAKQFVVTRIVFEQSSPSSCNQTPRHSAPGRRHAPCAPTGRIPAPVVVVENRLRACLRHDRARPRPYPSVNLPVPARYRLASSFHTSRATLRGSLAWQTRTLAPAHSPFPSACLHAKAFPPPLR